MTIQQLLLSMVVEPKFDIAVNSTFIAFYIYS